jgi:guanylate kinase
MNFETALKVLDTAVFTKIGRHLSVPEQTILRGSWDEVTYERMAETSTYSLNYLMRDIGPKIWKLLSEVLEKEVNKSNFRVLLEQHLLQLPVPQEQEFNALVQPANFPLQSHDWKQALKFSPFFGRNEELKTLKRWILEEDCRLIVLRGMSGVGKTALARQLAEEIQDKFDRVIWHSLARTFDLEKVMVSILKSLPYSLSDRESDLSSQLLTKMRSSRCLIVLDKAETILRSGQLAGYYEPGFENYGEFFRRAGEEFHQSCLIITSLENPKEVTLMEEENSPTQSLLLSGLNEPAAKSLLKNEKLSDRGSLPILVEKYQGNPAFLKIVAKTIRELFNGNIAEFLEQEAFIFGEIDRLLEGLFNRLSDREKEIVERLTIEGEAASFSTLQANISLSLSQGELLEVLTSLGQRGLIETTRKDDKSLYILQPMLMEYVTSRLIKQIGDSVSVKKEMLSEDSIELTSSSLVQKPVQLNQWFENSFQTGWQPLEELLVKTKTRSPKLRSLYHFKEEEFIKRFKFIKFGTDSDSPVVALMVAIRKDVEQKIAIRVQIHPVEEATSLPVNLKLSLIDDSGKTLKEVQARSQDIFIQLPSFRGKSQETFRIQLALNDTSITEDFVI